MSIRVKRVYDPPDPSDGIRILVDRIWPRGLTKERARLDEWFREIAPSNGLRIWFNHNPERWEKFQKKYQEELGHHTGSELVGRLRRLARRGTVTILYGARDPEFNQAVALAELLKQGGRRPTKGETRVR
jgi:uncharacterized protein YeaO (DUF488 family)